MFKKKFLKIRLILYQSHILNLFDGTNIIASTVIGKTQKSETLLLYLSKTEQKPYITI